MHRFFSLFSILSSIILFFAACKTSISDSEPVMLIAAKEIYLEEGEKAEAMAIKAGKIIATGSLAELEERYPEASKKSFDGQYIYPGFNDAHAHFVGFARGLGRVNLVGTKSWQECLERVQTFADQNKSDFIIGRGWDQNDWAVKEFPTRKELDSMFPNTPVLLHRVDGHAALVNNAAFEYAGLDYKELIVPVEGGSVYAPNDWPTGLLIDNAVDLIEEPELSVAEERRLLIKAQQLCVKAGLTSITDAGLNKREIEIIKNLIEEDSLKIRLNLMVSDDEESIAYFFNQDPIETPRLRVKTVKFYLDGALGSRGALMLEEYSDDPGNYGLQLKPTAYFDMMADSLSHQGWQMAVHAIGDSANRLASYVFGIGYMHNPDHRWRIEHAQVVHPTELISFKQLGAIPSIQPTHATSDMYWAEDRIGDRVRYAYSAKSFLDEGMVLPLGTDFPVEDINPLYTLRAAMYRQDAAGYPPGGFRVEEALSFDEAIRGMTWSGAYASFEEDKKGLLKEGYYADFVVFDRDLASVPVNEIGDLQVSATAINGEILYTR